MRHRKSHVIAASIACLWVFGLSAYANTDVGTLHAPYRGTINQLRNACEDVPYGEVWNYMMRLVPTSVIGNVDIWCEVVGDYQPWDRSIIRAYYGTDASGDEINLSGNITVAPSMLARDNVYGRLSFRAIGTKSLVAARFKIHLKWKQTRTAALTHSYTYIVSTWPLIYTTETHSVYCSSCSGVGDSIFCGQNGCTYTTYCTSCEQETEQIIELSVAPMAGSFGGEFGEDAAYMHGARVLSVSSGNAQLVIPIGKTANMIGTGILYRKSTEAGNTQLAQVELPWAAETVYLPREEQFTLDNSTFQKNDNVGYGSPWPGYMRGWYWQSSSNTVFCPDGTAYEYDFATGLLSGIHSRFVPSSDVSAVTYNYTEGKLVKISDHPGAPESGQNWIKLDRSTAGEVRITSGHGDTVHQNWRVLYDQASQVIKGVISNDEKVSRSYSWKKRTGTNLIVPVSDGGRVTEVLSGNTLLYKFDYHAISGELTTENHNIDGTLQPVTVHTVESTSLSKRKEYVNSTQFRQFDFNYDAANGLNHRLMGIDAYKDLQTGSGDTGLKYSTSYSYDDGTSKGWLLTQVTLPDTTVVAYTYAQNSSFGSTQLGLRTKTTCAKDGTTITTLDRDYDCFYQPAGESQHLYYVPRVVRVRDGSGVASQVTYTYEIGGVDSNGDNVKGEISNHLLSRTGPVINLSGHARTPETTYQYWKDATQSSLKGLLSKETTKAGETGTSSEVVQFDYDELRRLKSKTVDPGHENIVTEYRKLDKEATQDYLVRDPDGYVTRTQYDNKGRVWYTDRSLSDIGNFEGNPNPSVGNNFIRTENIYSEPTGWLYRTKLDNKDQNGNALTPESIITQYDHDYIGRLTKQFIVGESREEDSYTYNWQNQIETQKDKRLRGVFKEYNGRGLLWKETVLQNGGTATSLVTEYGYDSIGRLLSTKLPTGVTLTRVYDAAGRVTEEHRDPVAANDSTDVREPSKRITNHSVYDGAGRTTRSYMTHGPVVGQIGQVQDECRSQECVSDVRNLYDPAGFNYKTIQKATTNDAESDADRITERWCDYAGHVYKETTYGDDNVSTRTTETMYDSAGRSWAVDVEDNNTRASWIWLYRDGRGNVKCETVFLDEDLNYTDTWKSYDAMGRLVNVVSPSATHKIGKPDEYSDYHVQKLRYDSLNHIIRETLYEGANQFGENGVAKRTTVYEFDLVGRCTLEATLKQPGQLLNYTPADLNDQMIRYSYYQADGTPELKKTVVQTINGSRNDHVIVTAYDEFGRVQSVTDPYPSNVKTENTYDENNGLLSSKSINDGHVTTTTSFAYDGHDRVVSETTLNQKTKYGYDGLNRRIYVKDPKGHTQLTQYSDLVGTIVTVTNSEGEPDATNVVKRATTYTHDRHGNEIEQSASNTKSDKSTALDNQVTQRRFDALGRLKCTVFPDNIADTPNAYSPPTNSEAKYYDLGGRLVEVLNPVKPVESPRVPDKRQRTVFIYDDRGCLVERDVDVDEDYEYEVQEFYDADVLGNVTYSKRLQAFSPLQMVAETERVYTTFGALDHETQKIGTGESSPATERTTTYGYNEANLRTSITYPGGEVLNYVPTVVGQVDTIKLGTTPIAKYTYHGNGLLLESRETYTNSPNTVKYRTSWTYDGHRRTQTIGTQLYKGAASPEDIVTRSFGTQADNYADGYDDNNNLLTRRTSGRAAFRPYEYQKYEVDGFDRLTNTRYMNTQTDAQNGVEQVVLDAAGNRERFTDRGGMITYYDLANASNEYARIGSTQTGDPNLEYDSRGNLKKDAEGRTYTYDDRNHLIEVKSSDGTQLAAYLYDCNGRRVKTAIGSNVTHYYYDGSSSIEEYSVQGSTETLLRYHIKGGQYVDEQVATYDGTTGSFKYHIVDNNFSVAAIGDAEGSQIDPIEFSPLSGFGGGTCDFDHDNDVDADDFSTLQACWSGPGTAVATTCLGKDLDSDGHVDGMDYALFQQCMSGSGNPAPASCAGGAPPNGTFTMHGLPADVLPDGHVLLFARARHFDPKLGRWLQRDPKGYVGGPNLYEAFGGNPLVNVDPEGELAEEFMNLWYQGYFLSNDEVERVQSGGRYSFANTEGRLKREIRLAAEYQFDPMAEYYLGQAILDTTANAYHREVKSAADRFESVMVSQAKAGVDLNDFWWNTRLPALYLGDKTGVTPFLEGCYSVDLSTNEVLSTGESIRRGVEGGSAIIILVAGPGAMSGKAATNATRSRVLANIAESQTARAASRFDVYVAQESRILRLVKQSVELSTAEGNLGVVPIGKTLAANQAAQRTLSGWINKEGFLPSSEQVSQVMEKADKIGFQFKRAGGLDRGVPGRFFASHAEPQLSLFSDNFAVSREMCTSCRSFVSARAFVEGRTFVVQDPTRIWTFSPTSTSWVPR